VPGRRGQSLVEFALIFPILMFALLMLFDFGRVVFALNSITNNARDGARLGSVSAQGLTPEDYEARFKAIRKAAKSAPAGVTIADADIRGCHPTNTACMKSPACGAPLDALTGTCFYTCPTTMDATGCTVYVQIVVRVPIITPVISQVVGEEFQISAVSETLVQK
jgi:Flp pilus assembly protein TadG